MYIGRFAPSPTGNLHFGSLLAALASYLDAKKNNGLWRLRIDDLDPPREVPGSTSNIIETLSSYGLRWDKEIVYQSQNHHYYQEALEQLIKCKLSYKCSCSRKQLVERSGTSLYDRFCRNKQAAISSIDHSWRFKFQRSKVTWLDSIQGEQSLLTPLLNDFILQRKDKLWAYQIAVAIDDDKMGITNIVRGFDLLPESANQLELIRALNLNNVQFSHIPIIKNKRGQKLSKQNLAESLSKKTVTKNLLLALQLLGQDINNKLLHADKDDILQQAILNWDIKKVPLEFSLFHS